MKNKTLLWTIAILLLISSVSAFQPKDNYVKLIDNTDQCHTRCYTIYEINASDRDLLIMPDVLYKTEDNKRKRDWKEVSELRDIKYYKSSFGKYETIMGEKEGEIFIDFKESIILTEGNTIKVKVEGIKEPTASIDNILNIKLKSNIMKLELFDKTYSYDEYAWWTATQGITSGKTYYDDFEIDSSVNWTDIPSGTMTGNWTRMTSMGSTVMNQSNTTTIGEPDFRLNFTAAPVIPYAANITVKVLKNDFRDGKGFSGIVFNTSKAGINYHCSFLIGNYSAAQYAIIKTDTEISVNNFSINSSEWYWLKAEIIGNDIKGYISDDGVNYGLYVSTTILNDCKGNVGLIHSFGTSPTIFDNFEMIIPQSIDSNFINESYYTDVNETSTVPFYLQTNWTGSMAALIWNGTKYNGTLLTNTTYSNFSVNITIPLVEGNTTASFFWNYTLSNGTWTNKTANTQNIKLAYFVNLKTDLLNASYIQTETFDAYYNFTQFIVGIASFSQKIVLDSTEYTASLHATVNDYVSTYKKTSLSVPSSNVNLAGWVNVSFGGKSFIRTSNITIPVTPFNLFRCTHPANTTTLNISTYNLTSFNTVNTTIEATFNIWYGNNPITNKNVSFNLADTNFTYIICIIPNVTLSSNAIIKASAPGFNNLIYYLNNVSFTYGSIYDLDLYLSNGTQTLITFHIIDENANDVEGAYISVQKYIPSTGNYVEVSNMRTNEKGQTIGYFNLYSEIYKFIITYNSKTALVTEPSILNSNSYEWQITIGTDVLKRLTDLKDIKYSLSYNNGTGNARCIISDTSTETLQGCMDTTKRTSRGDTLLDSTCESGSSMTLLYLIGTNVSNTYIVNCYVNYNQDGKTIKYLLDSITINPTAAEMFTKFGMTGVFFGGFILLGTLMFAGLSYGISGAAVIMGIGVIILKIIGLLSWGYTTIILLLVIGAAVVMKSRT